jgi:hypothetical protein
VANERIRLDVARLKQHNTDVLLVVLLLFVYIGCTLLLCVLGANSYGQTVAALQEGYNQRSGVQYIAQKVHQGDIGGGIRVDEYNGSDALVLVEQTTGKAYETWIFIQDGYLCEELIAAGGGIIPEQAQRIMPLRELTASLDERMLLSIAVVTDTGAVDAVDLAVRSGGGSFNTGITPPASPSTALRDPAADGATIMTPAPDGSGTGGVAGAEGGVG